MSTGITFEVSPSRWLCALNVSNDCEGYIDITTAFVDAEGQAWDICTVCAAHERNAVARRAKEEAGG